MLKDKKLEDNTVYYDASIDTFYFKEAGLSEYLKEIIYNKDSSWILKKGNYKLSEKIFISIRSVTVKDIDRSLVKIKVREMIVKGKFYTYA